MSEQAIVLLAKKKRLALFLVRGTESILNKLYKKNFYYTKSKDVRVNDKDGLWSVDMLSRNDSDLVAVVEEMGRLASNNYSNLTVMEIPDGCSFTIHNEDGLETVKF